MTSSSNNFHVEISDPNSSTDQYIHNNSSSTNFDPVPEYPNSFTVWTKTNSGVTNNFTQISETSWEFLDNNGVALFASGDIVANTQFRDTVVFDKGCYTFRVTDTDDDGVDFWANSDGAGYLKFREIGASWLHSFEGDFGRFIHYEFRVDQLLSEEGEDILNLEIFPNPATNEIFVNGNLSKIKKLIITDNVGRVVLTRKVENSTTQRIDVNTLSKGIYFLSTNNNATLKKIVIQ